MWITLQLLEPTITGYRDIFSTNRLVAAVGRCTVLNGPTQVILVSEFGLGTEPPGGTDRWKGSFNADAFSIAKRSTIIGSTDPTRQRYMAHRHGGTNIQLRQWCLVEENGPLVACPLEMSRTSCNPSARHHELFLSFFDFTHLSQNSPTLAHLRSLPASFWLRPWQYNLHTIESSC